MHNIQLDAFEGPFDLLFNLIEANKIDIYDIPMTLLTRQYLEAIRKMPPDMEGMSEFLVMAATLLAIKAKMLLPRKNADEEEQDDPREALVQKLIAYRYCQELANSLKEIDNPGSRIFKGPEYPLMAKTVCRSPEEWLEDVSQGRLWRIFEDVMKRKALKVDTVRQGFFPSGAVARERFTIAEKMLHIQDILKRPSSRLTLTNLFEDCLSREECIVCFLALLELIKVNKANIIQQETFGEIEICQA